MSNEIELILNQAVQDGVEEAFATCQQAVERSPNVMSYQILLGIFYVLMDEVEQTNAIWLSLLSENSDESHESSQQVLDLLMAIAQSSLAQRAFPVAEVAVQLGFDLDPELTQAAQCYVVLGRAIAQQGHYDEALECWQQAAQLQPDLQDAYTEAGQVYQHLGEWAAALECYQYLYDLGAADAEWCDRLGLSYAQLNQWSEAERYWQEALQIDPNRTSVYSDLAFSRLQLGKVPEALADFQLWIQHHGAFVERYCDWAEHQPPDSVAASAYSMLGLGNTDFATQLSCWGHWLERTGYGELARFVYEGAIALGDPDPNLTLRLGTIAGMAQNWQQALIFGQRAIAQLDHSEHSSDLQPLLEAHLLVARAYARQEAWSNVIDHLEPLLTLAAGSDRPSNPLLPDVYLRLSQAYSALGEAERAIALAQQWTQEYPQSGSAYLHLGTLMAQAGDWAEGFHQWQAALNQDERLASTLPHLVQRLQQTGHTPPNPLPFPKAPQGWLESSPDLETPVHSPSAIHLRPPRSLDPAIHYSFRFGETMPLPGSYGMTLEKGRCWFDATQSSMAILTADDQLIPDLSPQFPILSPNTPVDIQQHRIFSLSYLAPAQELSGTTVVLAGLSNSVYFHWMLDVLPRFEILRQYGMDWAAVDHIVLPCHLSFQRETLERLGVPLAQCLDPSRVPHLQAERLIVPSFPAAVAWPSRWVCDFLRQHFLPESCKRPQRRLYLTRGQHAPRTILNEAEVVEYLQHHQFERVQLENLSVIEQAQLLAEAEVVIAPHGSGLTNLVFCQPRTKVIELFAPDFVYSCYWFLSNVRELDYAYLLGDQPEGFWLHQQLYTSGRLACIYLDVRKLDCLLHQLGIV